MKAIITIFILAFFASCNESSVSVEGKADSLGKELDTLGTKIEKKAEQIWDSTKEKAGDLKDEVEQRWDSSKVINKNRDTVKTK